MAQLTRTIKASPRTPWRMIGAFRVPAMPRGISTPKDVGSLGTHGIADFGTL
jgi:hypothetical protein